MIVDCENGRRVYESRGMGTAWTEAIGALSAVWVNARSGVPQKENLLVDALMTATIEERKEDHAVHSERACLGEGKGHCALPLGHGQQPHVFCWTGCRGQCFKAEDRIGGLRYVIRYTQFVAAACVLCAWFYLAVRRGWRCYCVCPCVCTVLRASLPHDTALVCGTVREVGMCDGVRVAVVSAHLLLPHVAPLGSLLQQQAVD
ncbi:putative trans-sialidase [Trypanosoma cruzi]|nr:putative trans-sialidase [Trypanosoma cruzi]